MGIFKGMKSFFADVRFEFSRVTWPTRQITLQSTGVVCVVTIAIAIYLGVIDLGLAEAIRYLLHG